MFNVVYRTFARAICASAFLALAFACAAGAATQALPKIPKGLPPRAYVVGTYDGSTLRLYVNGRVVATKPVHGTPENNQNPVEIGAYAGQGVWLGTIDEVAMYRSVLTPAEIARRYDVGLGKVHENYARLVQHTPGLAAYYPLDDAKGTQAHSRWKGATGAYEQPVHLGALGLITGDKDTAIWLNGKKGSVSVPAAAHDPGKHYSVEAWVAVGGIGNRHIVSKVGSFYLKTDIYGKWATGFYSHGAGYSVESKASAVSAPPSKPAQAGTTQKTSKPKSGGGGGNGAVWIPILLVIGGGIAAWRALRRSRQRAGHAAD